MYRDKSHIVEIGSISAMATGCTDHPQVLILLILFTHMLQAALARVVSTCE
jgi:hypothetical protein